MSVAEELIVQIKTEGVDIANDGLDSLTESFSDLVEEVREGSAGLTDFIGGFRGALGAILAGIAVVAGGLASQIPIISELLAGLGAVATAVGLKIDEALRPSLAGVVDELFDFATAIMEAEDSSDIISAVVDNFRAALVVLAALLAILGGVGLAFSGLASGLGFVSTAILAVVKGIALLITGVAGLLGIPVILAAVLVALAAFAAAWLLDIGDTREITEKAVQMIEDAWDSFIDYLGGLWNKAKTALGEFATGIEQWAAGLADRAVQYGKDIIDGMIEGIREAIPGLDYVLDNVGFNNNNSLPPAGPAPSGTQLSQDFGMSTGVMLDGRDVSDRTARYRVDAAYRRGL